MTTDALAARGPVDLSFPISRGHHRWAVQTPVMHHPEHGEVFHTTQLSMACHAFTHVDAPTHIDAHGAAIDETPLEQWVGEAAVVDLLGCGRRHAITAADLDRAGGQVGPGDIALIATGWDRERSIADSRYWQDAPEMTPEAASWLRERGVVSVGFDFPQDRGIARMIAGEKGLRPEDFVTHHLLLRNGVGLIEYLCNLHRLRGTRVDLVAAPLHLPGADGSPVRALAFERPDAPST